MTALENHTLTTRPTDVAQLTDALSVIATELAGSAQALHQIAYYLAARQSADTAVTVSQIRPHTSPEHVRTARTILSKLLRHGPELLVGIVVTIIAVMVSAYLFGESFR